MMEDRSVLCLLAAILIVCSLAAAGCTSIPGPGSGAGTTATTTPSAPVQTVQATPVQTVPMTGNFPMRQPTAAPPVASSVNQTCAMQGGVIVTPGLTCPGVWLPATDTSSCCSVQPVPVVTTNPPITVEPLDLSVRMDDDLGSIVP